MHMLTMSNFEDLEVDLKIRVAHFSYSAFVSSVGGLCLNLRI